MDTSNQEKISRRTSGRSLDDELEYTGADRPMEGESAITEEGDQPEIITFKDETKEDYSKPENKIVKEVETDDSDIDKALSPRDTGTHDMPPVE